ncbi:MAG: diaminopimelate decarboxylase [Pseudomonadota bacterium]
MNHFQYRNNEFFCEDVPVSRIAHEVGTPFYLYSHATLARHYHVFNDAFSGVSHMVCYSAKANSNIAVLELFTSLGSGLDIVSGGELYRGLKAGVPPDMIVYSGVGKRIDEIEYALKSGILMFNVESMQELDTINQCAARLNTRARISLRVNPDIDPKTHPYIATGMKRSKFGISREDAPEAYRYASGLSHLDVIGVDAHIGSQLTDISPFIDALKRLKELISEINGLGIEIKYLDFGGGLGITYEQETPPHPAAYAEAIIKELGHMPLTLIFEPGRVLVGNAGILVSRCVYVKKGGRKNFIIVDAAMNDLVRPSLYDAYHAIQPVVRGEKNTFIADVVGPICESGDFFAHDREVIECAQGDLLAVMSAGAYGFSMSSNYNSRPRVAEVMVNKDVFHVIRARETYEDIVRGETVPDWLMKSA